MSEFGYESGQQSKKFMRDHNIGYRRSLGMPLLVRQDENGAHWQHSKNEGADYNFAQIDFFQGRKLHASRMIAKMLAGQRTEIAY